MKTKIHTVYQNRSIFRNNFNENIKIVCKYFCLHINVLKTKFLFYVRDMFNVQYVGYK
jgi:hypothetical protein